MDTARKESSSLTPKLGLWDAVSLIVGIIIGVGIFETPANIFQGAAEPWVALGVWLLCGLLALIGAFCFAELATAYPRSGGEYVYLTRAFGPLVGYLFAWAQLTVIRPGSICALAYIFAQKAGYLLGAENGEAVFALAILSVLVLTFINILGVVLGSITQNVLTITKVVGLIALIGVGLCWGGHDLAPRQPAVVDPAWFVTAMILVFWTYAGWHEAAYVVAEIKDNRRNIPLALILGTLAVTVIYLLVNLAFLNGLGFEGAKSQTLAEDLIKGVWPAYGARAMSLLIVVSALGAMNGTIFTTARIYAEFGTDHRLFGSLSHWSKRTGTPARALALQGGISLAVLVVVYLVGGDRSSFDTMVYYTAAVFWGFFLLTGIALFVLRWREPHVPRPFRVPLYPVLPLIFCAFSAYMVYGAIDYKREESFLGMVVLLVGLPFYFWPKRRRRLPVEKPIAPVPHEMVS